MTESLAEQTYAIQAMCLETDWPGLGSPSIISANQNNDAAMGGDSYGTLKKDRWVSTKDRLWETLFKTWVYVNVSSKSSHKYRIKLFIKKSCNCRDYNRHLKSESSKDKTLKTWLRVLTE